MAMTRLRESCDSDSCRSLPFLLATAIYIGCHRTESQELCFIISLKERDHWNIPRNAGGTILL